MNAPCIMVVATEASGDALGADLIRALRRRLGAGARFVGVGGPRMSEQGVVGPFDIRPLSILGLFEGLRAYPLVLRRVREAAALAERETPDAAVLIDAWGFNLRLARRLRRRAPGLIVIKYVAPQVWATRPGRARTLARTVDHLLTIHAFDSGYFEREGLPTTFVGNPALSRDLSAADPHALRARLGLGLDDPLLLVLPGSRASEIDRLMRPFETAVDRLITERPNLAVVWAAAESVVDQVRARAGAWSRPICVLEGEADRLSAMRAATVALACSGTVTTELALAGCPMVVAYRLDAMTAPIARLLLRTKFITLFNVAAQTFVAPEFVQEECTGANLARAIAARLDDAGLRSLQVEAQNAALELMRDDIADPAGAAADAVAALLPNRYS